MYRNIIYFLLFSFAVLFLVGAFSIFKLLEEESVILKEGILTEVEVIHKWRGKHGSGYSDFIKYKILVNNKVYECTKACDANVNIGDRFYALYLKANYSTNIILFNNKLPD